MSKDLHGVSKDLIVGLWCAVHRIVLIVSRTYSSIHICRCVYVTCGDLPHI